MTTRIKIFDEFRNSMNPNKVSFEKEINNWLEEIQSENNVIIEIKDFKYFISSGENPQLICIYDVKGI